MEEETSEREVEVVEAENSEEVIYTCNNCGKETDIGYFYCEECHKKHKKPRQENVAELQSGQEKTDNEV